MKATLAPQHAARLARARARRDAEWSRAWDRLVGTKRRSQERFMAEVVALMEDGCSQAAIARELGVTRQAINEQLALYRSRNPKPGSDLESDSGSELESESELESG